MPSDSNDDREALTAWIDRVSKHWADIGMPQAERQRLRGELERDLSEALSNGAPISSLTAEHPPAFAEQVASANGFRIPASDSVDLTNKSLIATGLVGGALGATLAWNLVYPAAKRLPDFSGMPSLLYAVTVHVVAAIVVLVSALAAMRWRFRHDTTIGRTLAFAGPLIVLAGVLSIAPTVAFASLSNYSTAPPIVFAEFAIVAGFVSAAIVLARQLASRPPRPPFDARRPRLTS